MPFQIAARIDYPQGVKEGTPEAMPESRFKEGQVVCLANQPEQVGTVVNSTWNNAAGVFMCTVQFGHARRRVAETALALVETGVTPWSQLADGVCSGAARFRNALTFHRLRRPPSRIAHSFASARTQFFPHQFKPLLKFLGTRSRDNSGAPEMSSIC